MLEPRVVVAAARIADRGIRQARLRATGALDRLHLVLHRIEVRHDPATQDWIDRVRAQVEDGSIWADIAAQPPVGDMIATYRASIE